MQKKKHYILKLLMVLLVVLCAWIYFWDKPAPEKTVTVDLNNDILQN